MKSAVIKRSLDIDGHKTSVSLEDEFWDGMRAIATGRSITVSKLAAAIDLERRNSNLSSAIRIFVLEYYRKQESDRPIPLHD